MADSDDERGGGAAAPPAATTACPYLDTINRGMLDFQMQKLCSVTLSPNHVYACLVCGRFFEGRGRHTHAYTHSLQAGHHVFISLTDGRVWCLPDSYEVCDASLSDIKFALDPVFAPAAIAKMDVATALSTDVAGGTYLPGFVGMNNLGHTDYLTVVVQALAHVQPLRDFFLVPGGYAAAAAASPLLRTFGALLRRLWSPAAFKSTVSPIEFVTAVSDRSAGRFGVSPGAAAAAAGSSGAAAVAAAASSSSHAAATAAAPCVEATEFMVWLLTTLHGDLTARDAGALAAEAAAAAVRSATWRSSSSASGGGGGASGAKRAAGRPVAAAARRSIITDVFQGEVEVETLSSELAVAEAAEKARRAAEDAAAAAAAAGDDDDGSGGGEEDASAAASAPPAKRPRATTAASALPPPPPPSVVRLPFLFLSLHLPPAPLFRDDHSGPGGAVIAQVPLYTLLDRYDGVTVADSLTGQYRERRRYRVTRLPPFLALTVRRFARNAFFTDKNPTVVNFPVKNLEMRPYCPAAAAAAAAAADALPAPEALAAMRPGELKALMARLRALAPPPPGPADAHADAALPLERAELVAAAAAALAGARRRCAAAGGTKYDLCANIVHDSPPVTEHEGASGGRAADPLLAGHYRAHAQHAGSGQWYELQDLRVGEAMPQMIGVSQACIMIYRRQQQLP